MTLKTTLSPIDARLAQILAGERGLSVDQLISNLLRAEAALKVVNASPVTSLPLVKTEPVHVTA